MQTTMLVKKETDAKNITPKPKQVIDALIDARQNHNELVDAINALNITLTEISTKLTNLSNHKDIKEITDSVSFNADSVEDIKNKVIPALQTKMDANMKSLKVDLLVKVDENKEKIVDQEAHSRRRNIIINGVEELNEENTEEVAKQFLVDNLKLEQGEVDDYVFRDIHRLPKAKNRDGSVNTKPRPIIVAFIRQKDRNAAMKNAYNLKNTQLSIKSDLPKHLNELRSAMLRERQRLKDANPQIKYRVAERSYKPVLQRADGVIEGTTRTKWVNIKFPV